MTAKKQNLIWSHIFITKLKKNKKKQQSILILFIILFHLIIHYLLFYCVQLLSVYYSSLVFVLLHRLSWPASMKYFKASCISRKFKEYY